MATSSEGNAAPPSTEGNAAQPSKRRRGVKRVYMGSSERERRRADMNQSLDQWDTDQGTITSSLSRATLLDILMANMT